MRTLTPSEAAVTAQLIYKIIPETANVEEIFKPFPDLTNNFDLTTKTRFKATAGALMFKYNSGFGIIAQGQGNFKGDALLAIRGTRDKFRDLFLTDLDVGFQVSETHKMVHAGFNKTFTSFFDDHIQPFFNGKTITRIHCVGHSLGGGLATLAADRIAYEGRAQPVLYTFGSPRVGDQAFARRLTDNLGAHNIYRAYHKTDIVSMIPLWPFMHAPHPGTACYIDSPGIIPGTTYHDIEEYVGSVSGKSWDTLRKNQPLQDFDKAVVGWLRASSKYGMTVGNITMAGYAITYLLKKILLATGIVVQAGMATGLTLLDLLAQAIAKGAQAAKDIYEDVKGLVNHLAAMLGRTIGAVKDVTADLLRQILTAFAQTLYRMAYQAIELVHRV